MWHGFAFGFFPFYLCTSTTSANLAAGAGLEPATKWLTATRSAAELSGMEGSPGLEPGTFGIEARSSIQLSYEPGQNGRSGTTSVVALTTSSVASTVVGSVRKTSVLLSRSFGS